jgi:signal transduction histidine kinase
VNDLTLLNGLPDPVLVVRGSVVEFANDRFCERTGLSREQLPTTLELTVAAGAAIDGDWCSGTLLPGQSGELAIEYRISTLPDSERQLVSFREVAVTRNIEFDQLLEALPHRVFYTDADGRLLWLNERAAEKFSRPREQMIGLQPDSMMSPLLSQRMHHERQLVINQHRASTFSSGKTLGDNDGPSFSSEMFPVDSPQGTNLLVLSSDLVDHSSMHGWSSFRQTMLEHIARGSDIGDSLQSLVNSVRRYTGARCASVLKIDTETRRFDVVANAALPQFAFEFLSGAPVSMESGPCGSAAVKLSQQVYQDVTTEPGLESMWPHFEVNDMRCCCSVPIISPTDETVGALAVYFSSASLLNDFAHKVIDTAALMAGLAIEQAAREKAQRQLHSSLENEVLKRTRKLNDTVAELDEARAIAERATETKSRFLAAASHDLRQPLQAMLLYLSMFERELPEATRRDLFERLGSAVDSMGDILESLNDITRISSGQIDCEISSLPLTSLFSRLESVYTPLAVENRLDLEFDAGNLVVESNPALLLRILENLISNAIRHTRRGGVRVRALVEGGGVRLDVIDTGIGVPADMQETIFDEYVQLNNPGRNRSRGRGLGLAVVKQLSRLLGHRVTLISRVEEGSTFSIHIDRGQLDSTNDALGQGTAGDEVRELDAVPTVMVVDDDAEILNAMSCLAEHESVELHLFATAARALSALRDGLKPDLLLTDLHLADISGSRLVETARAVTGRELPAIIMTGDADIAVGGSDSDSDLVLRKPVRPQSLLNHIHLMIRPRSLHV